MTAMEHLPGVKAYLDARPSLKDVGTAPVLVQGERVITPGFA